MATASLPSLSKHSKIIATLGLALMAVAANSLNVPLFYGVAFIFGSIAVMIAIVFLGTIQAFLVALAGGLVTLILWEHPYALIIFSIEAVVVGLLYRQGIANLIIADFAYWLLIGMPLILFFYHYQLGMEWPATVVISLKQPLNGLFNALIAGIILIGLELHWKSNAKNLGLESLRLDNLIFHTLLTALMLIGGVAIVYESHQYRTLQESFLVENLTLRTARLIKKLETDPKANLSLELKDDMAIAVVKNDGRILSSQGEVVSNTAHASQLFALNDELVMWTPSGDIPSMQRLKQGRYVVQIPINGISTTTHLIIEQSATSLVQKLEYRGVTLLLLVTVLLALGLLLSFVVSHWLTRSLNKIETSSQNLLIQIANGQQLSFPDSPIQEYASLSATLKDMANHLTHSFESLQKNKAELENNIKLKTSELTLSQERLTFAVEGAGDGIWDWDLGTNTVHYSPLWMSMLGFKQDEFPQHLNTFNSLIHPDDKSHVLQTVEDFLTSKLATYTFETRLRCKNGNYKHILSRGMIVSRDNNNKPLRVVGTHTDITERKHAEQKIKLAASVFSHAREGILITDAAAKIIDVNETFTRITGYSRQEVIGKNPSILQSSGRQSPEFYNEMWQTINSADYWTGEVWNRRKNGEVYAETLTISAVKDLAGKVSHYVALFSDITQIKAQQNQLERMAHYDVLTNLPNRTLLADRLKQAMVQSQRHDNSLAVVFLDLDGFKAVNDLHGHDVGDELLIITSLRMKEALREGDTLARIGGDEFIAVLNDLTKVEDCEPALERLLKAAAAPVTVGSATMQVSASIGFAVYPQDNADADQLIRHADQAMYVAKKAGKNCYHLFDTAHDDAVNIGRDSPDTISLALDSCEFILYYQPKVNMASGDVIGVEALIRWQHPVRGLLPPLDFLPIIEGHPVSLAVGEWVIDSALNQISQWKKMGFILPISVNISAYQLQQVDFVERLAVILAAHPDVSPQHLELEVLETSSLDDVQHVSTVMNTCIGLGLNFSLDDFGTGYSSLTYLRRLPAYLIKIDQSFVRDMLNDPDDLAIIEGVVALTKSFKRQVIAEGVETTEHATALLQLGCELAQGYGIAKPMSAGDVPAWLREWKPDNAWRS